MRMEKTSHDSRKQSHSLNAYLQLQLKPPKETKRTNEIRSMWNIFRACFLIYGDGDLCHAISNVCHVILTFGPYHAILTVTVCVCGVFLWFRPRNHLCRCNGVYCQSTWSTLEQLSTKTANNYSRLAKLTEVLPKNNKQTRLGQMFTSFLVAAFPVLANNLVTTVLGPITKPQ